MRYRKRRFWIHYANGYSRSLRAEIAELHNRYPRDRAARHLGISTKAFIAGCRAAGYESTEWHHVGRYATPVDYYATEELAMHPEFWRGASAAYKTTKKRAQLLRCAEAVEQNTDDDARWNALNKVQPIRI